MKCSCGNEAWIINSNLESDTRRQPWPPYRVPIFFLPTKTVTTHSRNEGTKNNETPLLHSLRSHRHHHPGLPLLPQLCQYGLRDPYQWRLLHELAAGLRSAWRVHLLETPREGSLMNKVVTLTGCIAYLASGGNLHTTVVWVLVVTIISVVVSILSVFITD